MLKILPNEVLMPFGFSFEGTGLKSIIKWKTRTDFLDSYKQIAVFATEEVADGRKLYERDYRPDMHRWIAKQIEPLPAKPPAERVDTFQEIIRSFAGELGDFFVNDVTANTTEQFISDWMREWIQIGSWDSARDAANKLPFNENNPHPATWRTAAEKTITAKLNHYCGSEVIARKSGQGNYDVAIRPNSWAGFCWALIARDFYDDITYKPCSNFENCGHDVARLSLQGNKQKHCSNKCAKAFERKARLGNLELGTSEMGVNFKDVSADFQEWLRDENRDKNRD